MQRRVLVCGIDLGQWLTGRGEERKFSDCMLRLRLENGGIGYPGVFSELEHLAATQHPKLTCREVAQGHLSVFLYWDTVCMRFPDPSLDRLLFGYVISLPHTDVDPCELLGDFKRGDGRYVFPACPALHDYLYMGFAFWIFDCGRITRPVFNVERVVKEVGYGKPG